MNAYAYVITYQKKENGKIVLTSRKVIKADSVAEAKQKAKSMLLPTNTAKYTIISCVKV